MSTRSIQLLRREIKPLNKIEEQLLDASEKALLGIESNERFNRLREIIDRKSVDQIMDTMFGNLNIPFQEEKKVKAVKAREAVENKLANNERLISFDPKGWRSVFNVNKVGEEKFDKFDTGKLSVNLTFKKVLFGDDLNINSIGLQEYENLLVNAIKDNIDDLKLSGNDIINVSFTGPTLKSGAVYSGPIAINRLTNFADWKTKLLDNFVKVINSNDEVMFDNLMAFSIQHTRMPSGRGRLRGISYNEKVINKKSIVEIKNNDSLCFEMAVIVSIAKIQLKCGVLTENQYEYIRKNECNNLTKRATEMRKNMNFSIDKAISYADIPVYEEALKVKIHVVEGKMDDHIIRSTSTQNYHSIYLAYADNHYNAIVNIVGYFGQNSFCEKCFKPHSKAVHYCSTQCKLCHTECKCAGIKLRCTDCKKDYYEGACFEAHKLKVCKMFCEFCKCKITAEHKCGYRKCSNCKESYQYMKRESNYWKQCTEVHQCYMQKVNIKPPGEKYIFFDFETMQETGKHIVNYCCAVDFKGERKDFCYDGATQENAVRDKFCRWAISEENKNTTFVAHNGRGFDFQFVRKYLIDEGYNTTTFKIISNGGGKIMLLIIPKYKIRFIDSLNFFPSSLRKLPKTFGLTELKKGFFPHFFNTVANQSYVGVIPEKEFFGVEHFSEEETNEFNIWYQQAQEANQPYNFFEELKAYCYSDVDVLRNACITFRTQFMDLMNVDPFQYTTIPSTCMAVYRDKFMYKDSIASVPPYRVDKQSDSAIFWMECIMQLSQIKNSEDPTSAPIHIRHAYNDREFVITDADGKRWPVDGYCEATNTIYEFYGDEFHGCPIHKEADHLSKHKKVKYSALFERTQKKEALIRSLGYNLITMWECEFKEFKRKLGNPELVSTLKESLLDIDFSKPLDPRNAMSGGRVNAIKLLYKFKPGEHGCYYDITSLYPTVMYYDPYPVGHPIKLHEEFKLGTHHGLVHCRVLPPKNLYIPVLPYKTEINGAEKLLFPLCRSCIGSEDPCFHTDIQSSLVGTWTSRELNLAINKGYKVMKTYEIWHWDKWSDSMFKEYIKKFMQVKQEASGYPDWCDSEEKKTAYINEFKEKTGICMTPENIIKNAGKREIAKLCLNNLWGKFGQNTNKDQIEYVKDRSRFFNILRDSHLNIKHYEILNESIAEMRYNKALDCEDDNYATNIYIAVYTTSNARIRLYDALNRIGEKILYFDTDSVIFIKKENEPCPLEGLKGDNLGQFKDELDGKKMIDYFVATAPKSYGYKLENGKKKFKIKGFTLNYENAKILNYDSMIGSLSGGKVTLKNDHYIKRNNKTREIESVKQEKDFRFCYDKRVVGRHTEDGIDTLPYGYIG